MASVGFAQLSISEQLHHTPCSDVIARFCGSCWNLSCMMCSFLISSKYGII